MMANYASDRRGARGLRVPRYLNEVNQRAA
jgi:hypothetical protein